MSPKVCLVHHGSAENVSYMYHVDFNVFGSFFFVKNDTVAGANLSVTVSVWMLAITPGPYVRTSLPKASSSFVPLFRFLFVPVAWTLWVHDCFALLIRTFTFVVYYSRLI